MKKDQKDILADSKIEPLNFPVPYTLEQVRESVLTLFFQQARNIGMLSGDVDAAWHILGKTKEDIESGLDLLDPDLEPKDYGVTYKDIKNTNFAESIENMYQYAYLGIQQVVIEAMHYESIYMWVSAGLEDMANSSMLEEWGSYGSYSDSDAKICLEIAELANARRMLESHDNFYNFGKLTKENDAIAIGPEKSLTVRQMALLSGMGEMSIRAAANPKRVNPLPTYSDEGKTRISIEAAKKWLQEKNRYIQIKKRHGAGDFDLLTSKFKSIEDFQGSMNDRILMISLRDGWSNDVFNELKNKQVLIPSDFELMEINRECVSNPELLKLTAEILEFPYDLLHLRAREAAAQEELSLIESQLKKLQSETSNQLDQ